MYKIALFASGSGSNVENIANYFKDNASVECSLVLSNKSNAYVLERAKQLDIPSVTFSRNDFYNTDTIINLLADKEIDLIVLAGFLWLVPDNLIQSYSNKIINIHPALLPKYGGKGMYGSKVHEAVVANKESESGITIHLVNERYDEGEHLFQARCEVLATDSADQVAEKIHDLEYEHFPKIIEQFLIRENSK